LRTTWPWQGDRVASGLPPVGGVVLLDFVLLNLRGEWRGTTRLSTGVSPQGAGPGRGRQADRRGRPGAWISTQSIYTWWRQDRIDRGLVPSLISAEKIELAAAKRRIAELRATRRAMELVREVVPPKGVPGGRGDGHRRDPGRGGLPGPGRVDLGLLCLEVAATVGQVDPPRLAHRPDRQGAPGLSKYPWRCSSRARRATVRPWIVVGHNAVALLMRRAGIAGATGRPKWRHAKPDQVAATWWIASSPAAARTSCG
jgi:transposase